MYDLVGYRPFPAKCALVLEFAMKAMQFSSAKREDIGWEEGAWASVKVKYWPRFAHILVLNH